MSLLAITRFFRAVPTTAYAVALLTGALVTGAWFHAHAIDTLKSEQFAAGRKSVIDGARIDSTLLRFALAGQRTAKAHTDTVVRYVATTAARIDSQAVAAAVLARSLPPAVDTFPQVVQLKAAVFAMAATAHALADSIPVLVQRIDTERAAATMAQQVLGAQLTASNIIRVAQRDTIDALSTRPTKKQAVIGGAFAALLGFLAGWAQ